MPGLKKNVSVFNSDVRRNAGYRYTTSAPYSSIVANRRMTEATLRHIHGNCHSILDAGCGDGTYSSEIKRARPSIHLVGFDPSIDAIEIARTRHPGIQFLQGDMLRP